MYMPMYMYNICTYYTSQIQIFDKVVSVSFCANAIENGTNPCRLTLTMGNILGQTCFSNFGGAKDLDEGKNLN